MVYYQLEPFGTEAEMLGHAITSATVANANRKKDSKPYKPEDFMPDFEKAIKKQSTEEMIAYAEMITAALGGKDLR